MNHKPSSTPHRAGVALTALTLVGIAGAIAKCDIGKPDSEPPLTESISSTNQPTSPLPRGLSAGFSERLKGVLGKPSNPEGTIQHELADGLSQCIKDKTGDSTVCRTADKAIVNSTDYAPRVSYCTSYDENGIPTSFVVSFMGEVCLEPTLNPAGCEESTYASFMMTGRRAAVENYLSQEEAPSQKDIDDLSEKSPESVFYPFYLTDAFFDDDMGKSDISVISQGDSLQSITSDVTTLCDSAARSLENPSVWDQLANDQTTMYNAVTEAIWEGMMPDDITQIEGPHSFYNKAGKQRLASVEIKLQEDSDPVTALISMPTSGSDDEPTITIGSNFDPLLFGTQDETKNCHLEISLNEAENNPEALEEVARCLEGRDQ